MQGNQTTAKRLTKAAEDAVNRVLKEHDNDMVTPHCNEGVRNAFEILFDSKALYGMNANTMTRYWIDHPNEWISIQMKDAQDYANQGYFVVAGWINTQPKQSGHVVVVVPGVATFGEWNKTRMLVPNTMDTGWEMKNATQKITRSFGKNKHKDVLFFKYK